MKRYIIVSLATFGAILGRTPDANAQPSPIANGMDITNNCNPLGPELTACFGGSSSDVGISVTGVNDGIDATSNNQYGVAGRTNDKTGTYAGVFGFTSGGLAAVQGQASGNGAGVVGTATAGLGVSGTSSNYYGVYGQSTSSIGVFGTTSANSVGTAAGYFVTAAGSNSSALAAVNNSTGVGLYAHSASGGKAGYFDGNVTVNGNLTVNSCSGCTSDVRLKKNVEPLMGALDQLLKLKGVTFEWKEPSEHEDEAGRGLGTQTGFIAQDVEKVFPNWVKQDGYTAPDGKKYKTLELRRIEALEVESIRTLKTENDLLKQRVAALESGRQPRISGFNLNGVGFGAGGLAIGLGMMISRRKREGERS
jgi:hypothetical protein